MNRWCLRQVTVMSTNHQGVNSSNFGATWPGLLSQLLPHSPRAISPWIYEWGRLCSRKKMYNNPILSLCQGSEVFPWPKSFLTLDFLQHLGQATHQSPVCSTVWGWRVCRPISSYHTETASIPICWWLFPTSRLLDPYVFTLLPYLLPHCLSSVLSSNSTLVSLWPHPIMSVLSLLWTPSWPFSQLALFLLNPDSR